MAHARLAHRGVWALNEKRMTGWAELTHLDHVFAALGATPADLQRAIAAVEGACDEVTQEVARGGG